MNINGEANEVLAMSNAKSVGNLGANMKTESIMLKILVLTALLLSTYTFLGALKSVYGDTFETYISNKNERYIEEERQSFATEFSILNYSNGTISDSVIISYAPTDTVQNFILSSLGLNNKEYEIYANYSPVHLNGSSIAVGDSVSLEIDGFRGSLEEVQAKLAVSGLLKPDSQLQL